MKDQYFTPPHLAHAVLSSISRRRVTRIGDFAAGHGDLLRAVIDKWPRAEVIACDVDEKCVTALRQNPVGWSVAQCDFLEPDSHKSCQALRDIRDSCDVVVLNPPFSGRGGSRVEVQVGRHILECSRAMAFVLLSLQYLRRGGEIVAILPFSCLTSKKDECARDFLRQRGEVFVSHHFGRGAFVGCAAKTVVLTVRNRSRSKVGQVAERAVKDFRAEPVRVSLVRGCIPVFKAENGIAGPTYPFIHSTDICGQELNASVRSVDLAKRPLRGPAVLVARVGTPSSQKCCIYTSKVRSVISDCLIAIQCRSIKDAREVQRRMVRRWDKLTERYGGTCAPYITLDSLREFLSSIQVYDCEIR